MLDRRVQVPRATARFENETENSSMPILACLVTVLVDAVSVVVKVFLSISTAAMAVASESYSIGTAATVLLYELALLYSINWLPPVYF